MVADAGRERHTQDGGFSTATRVNMIREKPGAGCQKRAVDHEQGIWHTSMNCVPEIR